LTPKIEILYLSSWYDVSDYITNCSDIPIIATNEDYTISGEGFNFDISNSYDNTKIEGLTEVRFSLGSTSYFSGVVDTIEENIKDKTYKVRIVNILAKLKKLKVEYDVLHTWISTGSSGDINYIASDNFSLPNVQVKHLIRRVLERVVSSYVTSGLTVDLTDLEGLQVIYNKYVWSDTGGVGGDWDYRNFNFEDLRIDENMLYAINQDYAFNQDGINDEDEDYGDNKITLWDLIEQLCLMFSLFIYYQDHVIYVVRKTTDEVYTISEDEIYDKTTTTEEAKEEDYKVEIKFDTDRSNYADSTLNNLNAIYSNGSASNPTLTWMNNLVILLQDSDLADGYVHDLSELAGGSSFNFLTMSDSDVVGFGVYKRYRLSTISELNILEIETEMQTDYKQVISNYIDIENRLSIIKSGGYLTSGVISPWD
jgi:hypothetical protein